MGLHNTAKALAQRRGEYTPGRIYLSRHIHTSPHHGLVSECSLNYILRGMKHGRAAPMSSDNRRRAIVEAVIPLLIEQGANVTTREIAGAAGIAEGTIFRVFPDKCALIHEAIKAGMDRRPSSAPSEASTRRPRSRSSFVRRSGSSWTGSTR